MSGIVLSASVRQNLLSLQSTASLLATTQNNLATGNKVNSALDNPTNFFTAQGLNNRASDIGNLLDQIGNGVQVLQAANTGITSLQGYISTAQSIANQVLQAPTGYSTKSSVSSIATTGATADNLLGTPSAFTDATAAAGTAIPGATALTTKLSALTTAITATDSFTVDGKTISFGSTTGNTSTAAGASLDLSTATVGDLLNAVDAITGNPAATSTLATGALTLHTGVAQDLVIGGTASTLTALGLTAGTTARGGGTTALSGQELKIAATTTDGTTTATDITFGTSAGQIHTLNDLNTALAANDLQASIDSTGVLTITTSNNASSSKVGAFSGTAVTGTGAIFAGKAAGGAAAVVDPNSQATRNSLVAQYNQVISNINTTAQDSSFNGINLLNGDTLNLTFDETGASKLSITGVTFNSTGLGLSTLSAGTDFLDSNSANGVLSKLTQASTTLRTEASALGSNLSVVQLRQDFNKNLINVLQTGASNLTLADPNQEAANSQALSTRQSIAVSALALANQSQQSVLQLLR
ncbi:MAG: Flagellin [Bradyrhizobium sp.]|nr:Flagellin [Bradyrhizobium sp.]